MTRWLEIGPGESRLPGEWITLDCTPRAGVVDYVGLWGKDRLPFADNCFELVYASHVLEHVPWYHTVPALVETTKQGELFVLRMLSAAEPPRILDLDLDKVRTYLRSAPRS